MKSTWIPWRENTGMEQIFHNHCKNPYFSTSMSVIFPCELQIRMQISIGKSYMLKYNCIVPVPEEKYLLGFPCKKACIEKLLLVADWLSTEPAELLVSWMTVWLDGCSPWKHQHYISVIVEKKQITASSCLPYLH